MDAKEEIKQRLSVEDVVGDYIELKRAGRNLKGLSPFTSEKTPSLMVSPDKQIWHDFSSNQGGDMFSFVMLMDGIDFKEAMEVLARKAGVDLSQYNRGSSARSKQKKQVQEVLELAVKYYHVSLSKNKEAVKYLVEKRGYGKKIIQDFQLGYAPSSGTALVDFLHKKKFDTKTIAAAGLISKNSRTPRDMFRGRIMVPLMDGQGLPIGFTARVLDDSLPKYINTPQTIVYDKSRHVFGLHLAKDAIRKNDFVVVVEGNMDVVAAHKAETYNVVATAGTAMTADHLKQVHRLTHDVRLAFDTDKAGVAATERAIPIAQEVGVRLSIISIPDGKDPDDIIKKDPDAWRTAINSSEYVLDWLVERYRDEYDLASAEGKRMFTDRVLTVLARVSDPVEKEHYVKVVGRETDTSPGTVARKLASFIDAPKPKKKPKSDPKKNIDTSEVESAYEDLLLGLQLMYPDLRESLTVQPKQFTGTKRQAVMAYIADAEPTQISKVPADLQEHADYVKILLLKTEELYSSWSSSDRLIEAAGLARRLARDTTKKYKTELSRKIQEAEQRGDTARRNELLTEFNQLLKENT